jgi:hypothetical protein
MRKSFLISLFAAALVLGGCDNLVEPISESRTGSVAVYGVLDMRMEEQVIRLEALRSTILAESSELDDVTIRSIAVGEGSFQDWTRVDSTDSAGNPITLFVASFTPKAGTTYRVDVFRNGEVISEARTTIPSQPRLVLDPVIGDESTLSQTLYLAGLNGIPESLTVAYTVVDIDESDPVTVPVPYGRIVEQPVSQLNFDVTYFSDRFVVMNQLGRDIDESGVRLRRLEMSFDLISPEWNEINATNVTGGLGFFASVGRYTYSWALDDQSVSTIGWVNEQ